MLLIISSVKHCSLIIFGTIRLKIGICLLIGLLRTNLIISLLLDNMYGNLRIIVFIVNPVQRKNTTTSETELVVDIIIIIHQCLFWGSYFEIAIYLYSQFVNF